MALYKGYIKGVNEVDPTTGSVFDKDGFIMKGDIEMDGNEVKGLGAPTDDTSATTKKWVDDEIIKRAALTIQPAGFTMTGNINMGNNKITNLKSNGGDFSEAANVQYVHTYAWNNYLATNGFNKMKGVLDAGGFEIQGLTTTASKDGSAVSRFFLYQWANGRFLPLDGSVSMSGDLDMSTNEIKALGDPTTGKSAVSKDWTLSQIRNLDLYVATLYVQLDGTRTMTGNLQMGGNQIENVGDPTTGKAAVNKDWVVGMLNKPVSGLNISGDIDMKNHEIKNVKDPSGNQSAVTKKWAVDNNFRLKGGVMQADVSMGGWRLFDLIEPKLDSEAVSKGWVGSKLSTYGSTIRASGFTMTGDIDMGGNKIENVADPTTPQSVVTKSWFNLNEGTFLRLDGTGSLNVGGTVYFSNTPTCSQNPRTSSHLVNLNYLNSLEANLVKTDGSRKMTGDLNMDGNEVENVSDPTVDTSAASARWVKAEIARGRSRRSTYGGLTLSDDLDMGNNEIIKLGAPTTDNSAVSKKWVTDHVSGSSVSSSGFTMSGNIDMAGNTITGLNSGSTGSSSVASYGSMTSWCSQFLKRDGGTLASNLDVNDYELTKVGNPTTDGSAVNKRWATDEFMSSRGGLVKGDLDMGDSSGILDLKDPVNDKDAVNKQWVEKNFLKPSTGLTQATADLRYVRIRSHIHAEWIWGYRGVSTAAARYYAYCHDQIPPSWRTDPIDKMADLNLESITIKSDYPRFQLFKIYH